ncbi:TetR/AcrR family transcriptional regulator [Streptomyces sedi]|uniref:TetR/AcrR family transcriptional regulator n=1 Tax=Streptomyces sedi TaxID=555059 RepID=A0A5C4URJ2_9ACTN|nr:TetR/AcrR family transcriptional regulator C-terminal domain-containing protein [Streptomyces sedi]TNM26194.1 TetR/AcrR family transcriptional regulator [Streptomyces sedi]
MAEETRGRDPEQLLELLWRTRAPGARGPRGSLSVDQVVAEGVRIADEEGIAGVSMRRIAQALGVTTMTLYRYVPGKDDLLDLMFDMALGAPATAEWPDDWRGALRSWAAGQRRVLLDRPWMLDIPVGAPPMGPHSLSWMEAALAALDPTALDEGDTIGVLMIVGGFVLGDTRQELAMSSASARTGLSYEEWGPAYGRMMARAAIDERYPTVAKLARSGVFEAETAPGEDFAFNLEFLLDSVAALIGRREQAAASPPSGG